MPLPTMFMLMMMLPASSVYSSSPAFSFFLDDCKLGGHAWQG